ncbi:hypothetical protein C0J52_11137 [Blattella germanica]|nr:hypothetical protein C0J52_11137 [Blattella germanica]
MNTADDEGNWKRRKVASDKDEDEDGDTEKGENAQNESKEGEDEEDEKDDGAEEKEEETPMETEECDGKKSEKQGKDEAADDEKDGKDSKERLKKESDSVDDQLWSETDRDIGNLLDTVDGEGGDEDLNEEELLNPKNDSDSPGKGTRSSRNKAIRGGGSANKAVRGRKKK